MRRMLLLVTLVAGMMLLNGCRTNSAATDTFCAVYVPVYVSRLEDRISETTAQMILRNNLYWRSHCAPSSS